VVDAAGYPLFFVYSCFIGVPAVLVVLYLMRHPPPATLLPQKLPPETASKSTDETLDPPPLPAAGVSRGSS
jgi:hypothetical protein